MLYMVTCWNLWSKYGDFSCFSSKYGNFGPYFLQKNLLLDQYDLCFCLHSDKILPKTKILVTSNVSLLHRPMLNSNQCWANIKRKDGYHEDIIQFLNIYKYEI